MDITPLTARRGWCCEDGWASGACEAFLWRAQGGGRMIMPVPAPWGGAKIEVMTSWEGGVGSSKKSKIFVLIESPIDHEGCL